MKLRNWYSIFEVPTFIYFKDGSMYEFPEKGEKNYTTLKHFINEGYKLVSQHSIPRDSSNVHKYTKLAHVFMNALWIAIERDPITASITILGFFATILATIYVIYFVCTRPSQHSEKERQKYKVLESEIEIEIKLEVGSPTKFSNYTKNNSKSKNE